MKKTIIIICLFFSHVYSQNLQWVNHTFGGEIMALTEEGNYLWVGTYGGLVKMNKQTGEMEHFNCANSPMQSNKVRALAIDSSGVVWIGTWGGGLSSYDGENWIAYDYTTHGIPHGSVTSIVVDSVNNKWIGTMSAVYKYDGDSTTAFLTSDSGKTELSVWDVIIDADGIIWTAGHGIASFDGLEWTNYTNENSGYPDRTAYCIAIDSNNNKWIGSYKNGLVKFDGENWESFNTSNSSISDDFVISITIDSKDNKWAGTHKGGIAKFNDTDWEIFNTSTSPITNDEAWPVLIDVDNIKWIGTYGGGLFKYNDSEWTNYNPSSSGIGGNFIKTMDLADNGDLWIGGYYLKPTISKLDGDKWKSYTNPLNSTIRNPRIYSVSSDRNNQLWFGHQEGLTHYDDVNWITYNTLNSDLPDNVVQAVAVDQGNNKWIGTKFGGLAMYIDYEWTIYNTSNSSIPTNEVTSISFDVEGNKWIGTVYQGLCKFDGETWARYLSGYTVNNTNFDQDGNVWVCTNYGLVKYDYTEWVVYNVSNSELTTNDIKAVDFDSVGNAWIATYGGGVFKFDGESWINYKKDNSILSDDYISSIIVEDNGNVLIGTEGSGLVIYNENGVVVSVEEQPRTQKLPEQFVLKQNYPNPFNPSTIIKYDIPTDGLVNLIVYNSLGEKVAELVNKNQAAGSYSVKLNAEGLPSGVYFYNLSSGNYSNTKKMIFAK